MDVRGTKSEKVTLTIDASEIKRIVVEADVSYTQYIAGIRRKFFDEHNLPYDAFIHGDMWMHEVEYHGSHSSYSGEDIREATPAEKMFMKELSSFQEALLLVKLK